MKFLKFFQEHFQQLNGWQDSHSVNNKKEIDVKYFKNTYTHIHVVNIENGISRNVKYLKWCVPSLWPNPDPGTTQMPVSSNNWKQYMASGVIPLLYSGLKD